MQEQIGARQDAQQSVHAIDIMCVCVCICACECNQRRRNRFEQGKVCDKVSTNRHATHCNTLQHTATHCNSLQLTATHCNSRNAREQGKVCNKVQTQQTCNALQLTAVEMYGSGQGVKQSADAIGMAYTHAPNQCIHTCTDTLDAPRLCCENQGLGTTLWMSNVGYRVEGIRQTSDCTLMSNFGVRVQGLGNTQWKWPYLDVKLISLASPQNG